MPVHKRHPVHPVLFIQACQNNLITEPFDCMELLTKDGFEQRNLTFLRNKRGTISCHSVYALDFFYALSQKYEFMKINPQPV